MLQKFVQTIPFIQILVKEPTSYFDSMAAKQLPDVKKWAKSCERPSNFPSLLFTDVWWGCFLEFILIFIKFKWGPLEKSCGQHSQKMGQLTTYNWNPCNIMIAIKWWESYFCIITIINHTSITQPIKMWAYNIHKHAIDLCCSTSQRDLH